MISPLLAKLYGIILEKNINSWLECQGKRDKGHANFSNYHSSIDHLVTLKITAKECGNNIHPISFVAL